MMLNLIHRRSAKAQASLCICANAQTRLYLRCSHTHVMKVNCSERKSSIHSTNELLRVYVSKIIKGGGGGQ